MTYPAQSLAVCLWFAEQKIISSPAAKKLCNIYVFANVETPKLSKDKIL
jgi:hypothetical protein